MSNKRPIYYCQWSSSWARTLYTSTGNASQTIATSGCGITSMAMVLATWVDSSIIPPFTAKLALNWGDRTKNDGTSWDYFGKVADKYKLKYKETANTDEVVQALKNGAYVICSMSAGYFTKHGHFILAYDTDGTYIYVNDPNHYEKNKATIQLFREQCVQYFIFYNTQNPIKKVINVVKNKVTNANSQASQVPPKTNPFPRVPLSINMSGNDVKCLQNCINKILKPTPENKITENGQYTQAFADVVKKVQSLYGLQQDGVTGVNTINAIKKALNIK